MKKKNSYRKNSVTPKYSINFEKAAFLSLQFSHGFNYVGSFLDSFGFIGIYDRVYKTFPNKRAQVIKILFSVQTIK